MHCDENEKVKKKLLNRLRRIEGQVRGIYKMVENDEYCVEIITQSQAAQKALLSFEAELLENHLRTCVVSLIKSGKVSKATKEIMNIYKSSRR